jgi:myosin protein heavy chain
MTQKNEVDFDGFIDQISNDPDLAKKVLNPEVIDQNIENMQKVNEALNLPLLICENSDIELPNVKTKVNFLLPASIRKSKDRYAVSLKNDLDMYRQLYEKHSERVNEIIKKTKDSIIKLYPPIKKIHDEIKKYSNNFEGSIKQLDIPYRNKKNILNQIDYKKFPESKQKEFIKDKEEVINEINGFIKDINEYYAHYDQINKGTLLETEHLAQLFTNLAKPAKELTTFMRIFCTKFEKSANQFNDLKDKKKIDNALQKIKEPINEFMEKIKNIETILDNVKETEFEKKISNINETTQKIKAIINNLQTKADGISKSIKRIMEKYGLTGEKLEQMNISETPTPLNTLEINQKIIEEKKVIDKLAEEKKKDIKEDANNILNQSRLDLLFIMDITNSMDIYVAQVRAGILDMINEIKKQCAGCEIYLGFIGYKDFSDLDFGEKYINFDFTKDYNSIVKGIENIKIEGGGDIAEDLCGGLEMGKNKEWSGKSRFAILVTDSPCHGKKYHDLAEDEDNFPEGDKEKRNIEDYIKFFAENEISLYCLKINNTTDKMFKIFKDVYDNNKNKNSKCEFVVQEGKDIFNIVTENAVKIFRNRKKVEIKE